MAEGADKLLKWVPVVVLATGVVASAVTAQLQIGANAQEIEDISESVDQNEEDIEAIQRILIQRQGEVEIRTQRIELEQKAQGEDLQQILNLLQQIQRQGGN